VGSGGRLGVAERGSHRLNETPDEWPLFAVTGFAAADPDDTEAELG
jgi:hypothetical protein